MRRRVNKVAGDTAGSDLYKESGREIARVTGRAFFRS